MKSKSRQLDNIYINKLKKYSPRIIHIFRIRLQKSCKFNYLALLAITRSFFREKDLLKFFLFVYTIYFIGVFAIIRANIYFVDDNIRSVSGSFLSWRETSRYSMIKLAEIFNIGTPLVEFSPLSNLLCIAFLSLSSLILVKIINKNLSYLSLLSSVFIGLNPYFLENLLFKFDSIYMCIAILMTILPFMFIHKKIIFSIFSIICLLIMLTDYQSVNFIYLMIAIFITFLKISNKQIKIINSFNILYLSIICYILSLVIFKVFIFIPIDEYNTTSMLNAIHCLKENIISYYKYVYHCWDNHNFTYLILCCILLSYIYTLLRFKNFKSIIFFTLFITICFSFSQGIYLLIDEMPLRPRYISAIGVFFAINLIYISNFRFMDLKLSNRCFIFISKVIIFYTIYALVFMANMLGSILQEQYRYIDFRLTLVLNDLSKISDIQHIQFRNVIFSPSTIHPLLKFPVFVDFIPNNFHTYGFSQLTRIIPTNNYDICTGNNETIISTYFHRINKYENNCFEVFFK